jgi:5-(carboxyamino)imidazole ribonucleotide synthase
LAVAQDRREEKTFLNAAGIATVGFAAIASEADLRAAFQRLGAPLLIKTRRGGYDGKGQVWAHRADGAAAALASLGHQPAIAETPADFRREVALIAARGRDGEIALYPLTESHHQNGILRRTSAPAKAAPRLLAEAERIAATLLSALGYVGVLGLELFERDDGRLLVNEFAPRVHNTGHWTLDGCEVDQFEQHIRAGNPAVALWQAGGDARPQDGPCQPPLAPRPGGLIRIRNVGRPARPWRRSRFHRNFTRLARWKALSAAARSNPLPRAPLATRSDARRIRDPRRNRLN